MPPRSIGRARGGLGGRRQEAVEGNMWRLWGGLPGGRGEQNMSVRISGVQVGGCFTVMEKDQQR